MMRKGAQNQEIGMKEYPFPADYFEPYVPTGDRESTSNVTVHLRGYQRNSLPAEALAARSSVSGLGREWIDELLDLPDAA
jgi:hypothetical protein